MNALIDLVTDAARRFMFALAKPLDKLTGGHLSPNAVTLVGMAMHLPIAYLIAQGYFGYGAMLLVVFGLFDALDGALARVQKRTSNAGMLLDASTDRIKEVMLYTGIAYAIISGNQPHLAAWAVVACGASICVSYIKAKGETAIKDANLTPNEINRLFSDGLFRFQVRMLILVIGLLSGELVVATIIIAIGSGLTATSRLLSISRKL